jgi:hypothetical protein
MSLPAAWFVLPYVGAPGNQGPYLAPCADSQVRGLFRRAQFEHRPVRARDVPYLQRRDFPGFPRTTVAPANPWTANARRARQCPLSSRETPGPIPTLQCPTLAAAIPAALRSTTRPHRASLDTHAPPRDAQPLLRNTPRGTQGGQRMLRQVAPIEYSIKTPMLHYLSRRV